MNGKKENKYDKTKYIVTKRIILKIVLFILILSTLLYFGINVFNKNFNEKSIDVNGIKELNNLDVETYDVKALSLEFTDEEIVAVPISYSPEDSSTIHTIFYITSNTNFYKRKINNTLNKDGETFSTIDYEVITRLDLQEIIASDKYGTLTYFWTNSSNECINILISYE